MKALTKKVLTLFTIGALASALVCTVTGCGSDASSNKPADDKTIVIGASPTPHTDILKVAGDVLAKDGYTLDIVEYNDYVIPNIALNDGEIDANYFQHQPYLDNFNEEKGTDLVGVAPIHFEAMGIYGGKSNDLSAVPEGAIIAVPSDATNEARALLLLQDQGVIKLDPNAGLAATPKDIVDNPYNVDIKEVEAASLPQFLQDADFVVINGNYALTSGIDYDSALAFESSDSELANRYANVVAVRADEVGTEKIDALVAALTSDEVREYIDTTYQGAVVPVF